MAIHDWPEYDRPREKLLTRGEEALTDAELLAIFLRTGSQGLNAVDMAKQLLNQFGGLKNLMRAPFMTLVKQRGIGKSKYAALRASMELGKRCLTLTVAPGEAFASSSKTRHFLGEQMRHHTSEVFACLFLDSQYRLIHFDELFHGTIQEATVYPREIVRRGLLYNAACVIIAHNHPSGLASPSPADLEVTLSIKKALTLVDIRLIDHIIIGDRETYSLADAGAL